MLTGSELNKGTGWVWGFLLDLLDLTKAADKTAIQAMIIIIDTLCLVVSTENATKI